MKKRSSQTSQWNSFQIIIWRTEMCWGLTAVKNWISSGKLVKVDLAIFKIKDLSDSMTHAKDDLNELSSSEC